VNKPQVGNLQPPKAKSKRRRRNKGMCLADRSLLKPNAAGIDVGAREMFVAVPPGRDENPVRVFATFTEDLERLTDWLEQCGVTTVALESTGVYWIPLFEILEQRGIRPCLVNARHMKNVPGRASMPYACAARVDWPPRPIRYGAAVWSARRRRPAQVEMQPAVIPPSARDRRS